MRSFSFLFFFCSVTVAIVPEIVEFTDSINVIVNSSVHYSCTGVGSEILYLINGTAALDFIDEGFITQIDQDVLGNGLKNRNLTLTSATIELNNTNVQCRATVFDLPNPSKNVFSNISTLKIQGPLASVDIHSNFVNSTSLNITWSAPYTLDGVDILGYNITLTNTSNGNILLYTFSTQDVTQYVINSNDGDPCTELTLTISGYNGAGDGDIKSFSFYYPQVTVYTTDNVILGVTRFNNSIIDLSITLNVTTLCPGQYPTDVSINVTDSYKNYYYEDSTIISNGTFNINLQPHTKYIVNFIFSNIAGTFDALSYNITTFDIQNTMLVLDVNDSICVQCIFADISPTDGCHIELTYRDTTSINIIRPDNCTSDSVEGCISDIDSGTYNISIYDIDSTVPFTVYRDIVFTRQSYTIAPSSTSIILSNSNKPTSDYTAVIITSSTTMMSEDATSHTTVTLSVICGLSVTLLTVIGILLVMKLLHKKITNYLQVEIDTKVQQDVGCTYYNANPAYCSRRHLSITTPLPTLPIATALPDIPPRTASTNEVVYEEIHVHEYLQILEDTSGKNIPEDYNTADDDYL